MRDALCTIAVPSFNQGRYLEEALTSIFAQNIPLEVYVLDGGSRDNSLEIIQRFAPQLAGWRSHDDNGQAASINEGLFQGHAPYVAWLNSDDYYLADELKSGLAKLVQALEDNPAAPMAYGRAVNFHEATQTQSDVWVEPFDEKRLATRCIISQPATLMRRTAFEAVNGVDSSYYMAMDYELWWKLYKRFGAPVFVDDMIAVNRDHADTKTNLNRLLNNTEAMRLIQKYHGHVPWRWHLAQAYTRWLKHG